MRVDCCWHFRKCGMAPFCWAMFGLLVCCSPHRLEAENALPDALAARLDAIAADTGFAGAVGVSRRGEILLSRGIGLANVEHQVSNTSHTKFRIGSLTKQFTAMALMILQEQNKLSLEDPIGKHINPVPDAWNKITVHQLLNHTSGIPSFTSFPDHVSKMTLPFTPDEMLERIAEKELDFVPGSGFRYSNSGYFLLGMIIETVSGSTYEDFLQSEIFLPLGMSNSGYDHFQSIVPDRATGYAVVKEQRYRAAYLDMSQPFSAGALYSTVDDLLIWDRALKEGRLLTAAGYQRMWKGNRADYAYGWSVSERGGRRLICHGGGINGFSSYILRIPDEDVCVVVLSNISTINTAAIARELAELTVSDELSLPVIRSIKGTETESGVK